MKKIFLLYIFFLLLLASCKKKDFPQNISEDPTFYISAVINGKPLDVKAGVLNYYMYSSFKQDSNNLYTFVGEMKPGNCTSNCTNSFKIEINDNQLSVQNGTSNVTSSVRTGGYLFASPSNSIPSISSYSVQFASIFPKTTASYAWSFGDGGTSNLKDPVHTYSLAGTYNANVVITSQSSATAGISNPVKVTIDPNVCQTRIIINSVSGDTVHFANITSSGAPYYTYHWDFGDTTYSPDANPTHVYNHTGLFTPTLSVTDGNQNVASYAYNINTSLSNRFAPNFSVSSVSAIYSNTLLSLFSKVKITYTDGFGVVYSSNLQQQTPGGNNFQIISVDEYKRNENNQTTKKIKFTFNCQLFNGTNSISVTNGEAVMAFSYK